AGIELATRQDRVKRGKTHDIFRYRWLNDVPLRGGKDALKVNWFEIEIVNRNGEVTYRNSFVTDLPVGADNVAEFAACGRARWKIENETFNVLKTKGYNIEHNFGHGKHHLAAILVTLNLLAFAMHTVCDIADELWRAARQKLGSRSQFFNSLAAITTFLIFPSWQDPAANLGLRKTAATPALTPVSHSHPNSSQGAAPQKTTKCQNENCWTRAANENVWVGIYEDAQQRGRQQCVDVRRFSLF